MAAQVAVAARVGTSKTLLSVCLIRTLSKNYSFTTHGKTRPTRRHQDSSHPQ